MQSEDFFAGKVAVITGSTSGIGRETAIRLAARGAKVAIVGHPNPKGAGDSFEATITELFKVGGKDNDIVTISVDLLENEAPARIIEKTVEKFGKIDILINSAGFISTDVKKKGVECPIEHFAPMMDIHCKAIVLLVQAALPHLEKTRGSIVNISSLLGQPFMNQVHLYYSMAKAAQDNLTVQLAGHLIKKGVRVNAVCPSTVMTNIVANSGFSMQENVVSKFHESPGYLPNGRFAMAEDIAKVVVFLADGSQSEYINGAIIPVDGGARLMNAHTTMELSSALGVEK